MEQEEWKVVPSYPDYEASNIGRIRRCTFGVSTFPGRILKTPVNRYGYLKATLFCNRKAKHTTVHSLVAEAFLGIRNTGMVVNHKDLNKKNCSVGNLEYVTRQENEYHARINGRKADSWRGILSINSPTRKITIKDALEIRNLIAQGFSQSIIGKMFGISQTQISRIHRGKRWGWLK